MSDSKTSTAPAQEREFVLGQELRARILTTAAETPAHLATPETEFDADQFRAVTTELGDVILGPPGTTPADFV